MDGAAAVAWAVVFAIFERLVPLAAVDLDVVIVVIDDALEDWSTWD